MLDEFVHLFGFIVAMAAAFVSVLLAALLVLTAARKLSHRDDIVASYARVGVPEARLNQLAMILLLGAAGLIVGIAWAPAGVAAAIGLVAYFVAAVSAHIRADDASRLPTPLAFEALAVAALALRLPTL
jgi:DoxX-like family